MERTLILVKPDGVQRGLIGDVISRFERRGLKLIGMKFMQMSSSRAAEHYAEHIGKPFYPGLVAYIISGPIVAMVWEGNDAVAIARNTIGATKPAESAPGTIRGDFALEIGRNMVHGSDSPESGERETAIYFSADELVSWDRITDTWISEDKWE